MASPVVLWFDLWFVLRFVLRAAPWFARPIGQRRPGPLGKRDCRPPRALTSTPRTRVDT